MSTIKVLVIAGIGIADKLRTEKEKSYFEDDGSFKRNLIQYLKEQDINNTSYLIIIGDFTKDGVSTQFDIAASIIEDVIAELNINKHNIMFVPGRCDISYSYLRNEIGNDRDFVNKISMNEKLLFFKKFYDNFFNTIKEFLPSNVIWDQIEIPELRTNLTTVNTLTNYSYNNYQGKGHIDNGELNNELGISSEGKTTFSIIFGYNGFTGGDEENLIDNASEIQDTLSYKNVHVVLNRVNEVDAAKRENSDSNYYIGISDIGDDRPYFLIMEATTTEPAAFILKYHTYHERKHGTSYWSEDKDNPNVIDSIPINSPTGIMALSQDSEKDNSQDITIPEIGLQQTDESPITDDCFGLKNEEESNSVNKYLIRIIRKNKLFMSGHFHWSKNGRSLSFIKTEFFFENYDCLERIKILYKKMIEDYKLLQDPITAQQIDNNRKCLLIGYAMPGVLVGTQLAAYYKTQFSYIPAFIKYHTEDETEIPDDDFATVTVIIDMIYKSHIIDWILKILFDKERIKSSLKRVNIITLFWGNRGEFNSAELKINKEKKKNEGNLLDVKLYYINKFPLDKCNYEDKTECPVYCKKIAPVHVLSSED